MRLLVSVRNLDEARLAAAAGVDFIDLKDPAAGALGALPPPRIAEIVRDLRARAPGAAHARTVLSATTGDLASEAIEPILVQVRAVAATGVDLVKVGIDAGAGSAALLRALAHEPAAVVPVLMADRGVDMALVHLALALRAFPALMLDTAEKGAGSLLQRRPEAEMRAFIDAVQGRGEAGHGVTRGTQPHPANAPMAGLAGALQREELPALRRLGPDFAGFRSAVCSQGRANALDPQRLAALCGSTFPRVTKGSGQRRAVGVR